jgi:uncharacterized cofD-like protein
LIRSRKGRRITTIGGGSGQFVLLSGLRDVEGIEISAIVSMVDSGGSTGRLRDEMGVLPPGDILKCILALSPHQEVTRNLLLSRFQSNRRLRGHNAGNLLLTALTQYTGQFPEGVAALAEILGVSATVLPVTIDRATLVAELTDGSQIFGESAIDVRGDQNQRIRRTYLVPHHSERVRVYAPVLKAIREADVIVLGPGDLFTSIVPNLVVPGVARAIQRARAKVIYNANIMTKFGETGGFAIEDFVFEIERHIRRPIDVIVTNTQRPSAELLARYRAEKSEFLTIADRASLTGRAIVQRKLLDSGTEILRHDERKLARCLTRIFAEL